MRKLLTVTFSQAVFIFCSIISIVIFYSTQTVKAESSLTVEGVWVMTSKNHDDNLEDDVTIVRKGDGYEVREKSGGGVPKLFHGNATEIIREKTLSYEELARFYTRAPASALRQVGKLKYRWKYTLLSDGHSMLHKSDTYKITWDQNSGNLLKVDFNPFGYIATLVRVSGPERTKEKIPFTSATAQVESRGEFYVLTKDARKLSGKDANQIPLEKGTKVITGSSGHVRMKLPDDTTFTIGPNSDIVIDSFIYDPDNTPKKVVANMSKGVFRWVTGKTKALQDTEMKVKLPVMAVGIRGTDFEATVKPDSSGSVVLHFGQLEITENKTGFKFIMDAGYKVTFNADGTVSHPMKAD